MNRIHFGAGNERIGLARRRYLSRNEGYTTRRGLREAGRMRSLALSATAYEDFAIEVLSALQGNQ